MTETCASIVINNFNYGRFLPDAIESALAQTHENTEIIVVDDGSSDESRQVMSRYSNRLIEIFKANAGQASAYNAGFAICRGDVVCFLDSDDTLFETAIAQAVASFRDLQLVKVEWQLQIVDALGAATGEVVPERLSPEDDLRQFSIANGPFYDWWFTPPSSGNCYSRDFLRRTMPVPESPFRHGADVYLTILAPLYGGIHRLRDPQGTYRVHDKNNFFGRQLDSNRLLDYAQRFEDCSIQLQKHLGAQGVEVDIDEWKKRNFNYLWPTRFLRAKSDLESLLPRGGSYVLVDDNEWGNGEPIGGHHALPFIGNDGESWGRPVNDEAAIAEIKRHCSEGAKFLVFWWTCFWWLEHYPVFKRYLYSRFQCVLQNERLLVFELVKDGPVHVTTKAVQAI
jgi:glycosyltransferase involved in cell wall biosynthesis